MAEGSKFNYLKAWNDAFRDQSETALVLAIPHQEIPNETTSVLHWKSQVERLQQDLTGALAELAVAESVESSTVEEAVELPQ